MKKITSLAACILLVSSYAVAEDLPVEELPVEETPVEEIIPLQFNAEAAAQYRAQVDPEDTPALLKAMHQHQFRHVNRLRVHSMIQEAQKQGLPTEPITDKVYEGIAKKVHEDKIVQAVESVLNRYEKAYEQANTLITDKAQARQLGKIIAEAYTAGMKEEDSAKLITRLRTRTKTINQQEATELMIQTMITSRIMARRGVQSTTISDVLEQALQHSYRAREIHTLQSSFVEQTRYESPEDVARNFFVDINHGVTASQLGTQSSDRQSGSDADGSSSSPGNSSGSSSGSSGSSGSSTSGSSSSSGASSSSNGSSSNSGSSSRGSNGSSNGASRGSDRR